MHTTLDQGHTFELHNRCERGLCGEGVQQLQFLKIHADGAVTQGLFTQDVLKVVIERLEWQNKNMPYADARIEGYRAGALAQARAALSMMNMFTEQRAKTGAKLIGHSDDNV